MAHDDGQGTDRAMSRGRQDGTLIAHHQPIDRLTRAALTGTLTGNILAVNGATSIEVNQLGQLHLLLTGVESRLRTVNFRWQ